MLAAPELIADGGLPADLLRLLPRYLTRVPLYANRVAPGAGGESFRTLPFITKQDIRAGFPANFLGPDADLEDLLEADFVELEHTSGTSEERTPLLLGRGWWARQENRALRLNKQVAHLLDEYPGARRVTINSPMCSGDICFTGVPSRDDRIVGDALFVSLSRFPFLWSGSDLARMAAEAAEWEPLFLDVDPVYGVRFASYCEQHGIVLPSLRFIICSYEFVSTVHRRILERVFKVPVLNLYGSTETGHLLMENGRGGMWASRETAFLEVVDTDEWGVGDLVVTTLTNDYMPLVRYKIGDLVERRVLPCGPEFVVHGRALDSFVSGDGRRVTTLQIDRAFEGMEGIMHYQLRRDDDGRLSLRLVPDRMPPSPRELSSLLERLTETLRPATQIEIATTDLIMPETSGKFRLGYPGAGRA